jgi:ribonuclease P protein component
VRLAFAVPRRVGNAVVRNRVRRRLRASFRELVRAGQAPAGAYLVRVKEPREDDNRDQTFAFAGLQRHLARAVERATGAAPAAGEAGAS